MTGVLIRRLSEVKSLSRVQLFATPWTVANQAPPSMGFSRQLEWVAISDKLKTDTISTRAAIFLKLL